MTTGRDIILQCYREGGKAITMKCNSYRRINVAPYIRVSVKDGACDSAVNNAAIQQTAETDINLDDEDFSGVYIPTHERVFRNPPDDDPSLAEYILADYLRRIRGEVKRSEWKKK